MKVGIFDPYLDTLGGGEKYVLSIAKYFERENDVTIFWNENLNDDIQAKFALNLKNTHFKKNIFAEGPIISRYLETKKYDLFFFVSDGSIPFLFAKKNFLIFQFPLDREIVSYLDRLKLKRIKNIICYSNFIKEPLDKIFKTDSFVLYPAVEGVLGKRKKENVILSVGRFTKGVNNKKHDFMINTFKKLDNKDWKLIIAGSYLPGDKYVADELKESVEEFNIEIIESPTYEELSKLYLKSKIYWHATGVGEDITKYPQKAEHFGISTVEAMSAGCAPVVINAGGQKEIVEDRVSGYLWDSEKDLIEKTQKLIDDENLLTRISENAFKRSRIFNSDNFNKKLETLIL